MPVRPVGECSSSTQPKTIAQESRATMIASRGHMQEPDGNVLAGSTDELQMPPSHKWVYSLSSSPAVACLHVELAHGGLWALREQRYTAALGVHDIHCSR